MFSYLIEVALSVIQVHADPMLQMTTQIPEPSYMQQS